MEVNLLVGYLEGYLEAKKILSDLEYDEEEYQKLFTGNIVLYILKESQNPKLYTKTNNLDKNDINLENVLFIVSETKKEGILVSGGDEPTTIRLNKNDLKGIKKAVENLKK